MITLGRVLAVGAVTLLAACDELSSGPSFDDLQDDFVSLDGEVGSLPLIDPSILPASGGATYDGVMVLRTGGSNGVPDAMAGDLALVVDFGDDSLTGAVTDLVTDSDEDLDGSLGITNGVIDRGADLATEYTFGFDIDGTLTDEGDDAFVVAGQGSGDFYGSGETHVGGIVDGVVIGPDGNALIAGEFAAAD